MSDRDTPVEETQLPAPKGEPAPGAENDSA